MVSQNFNVFHSTKILVIHLSILILILRIINEMDMRTYNHNENLMPLNFTDWKITIKVISKCQVLGSD